MEKPAKRLYFKGFGGFLAYNFLYGETLTNKLLRLLCLDIIPCNQIILKPKLLRR